MNTSVTSFVQMAGIICVACLALVRGVMFRGQGVTIFAVDRSRTPIQIATDAVLFFTLVFWLYTAVTYCLGSQHILAPGVMNNEVLTGNLPISLGVAVTTVAVVVYGLGVWNMGKSWRIGIDRHMDSPLVTNGVFAFSRNPIYLGFDLLFVGSFLLHGRLILLVLVLILLPLLHVHVLREETFLAKRFGDEYRDYCNVVGRYMTLRIAPRRY